MLFEVNLAQTGHEGVCESREALSGGDDCLNPVSRGVPDLGKSGTGPEPVSELGEAGAGPAPIFVEPLDDPFINLDLVEDVDEGDSLRSPVDIIHPTPIQISTSSVDKPKR